MRTEHSLWQDGETAPWNKHIKWANILRIISSTVMLEAQSPENPYTKTLTS